jgi:hypothetical protein
VAARNASSETRHITLLDHLFHTVEGVRAAGGPALLPPLPCFRYSPEPPVELPQEKPVTMELLKDLAWIILITKKERSSFSVDEARA